MFLIQDNVLFFVCVVIKIYFWCNEISSSVILYWMHLRTKWKRFHPKEKKIVFEINRISYFDFSCYQFAYICIQRLETGAKKCWSSREEEKLKARKCFWFSVLCSTCLFSFGSCIIFVAEQKRKMIFSFPHSHTHTKLRNSSIFLTWNSFHFFPFVSMNEFSFTFYFLLVDASCTFISLIVSVLRLHLRFWIQVCTVRLQVYDALHTSLDLFSR